MIYGYSICALRSLKENNMANNTILQQGSFVSTGVDKVLQIRSDLDWMRVYNYTNMDNDAESVGIEFYWQRGMPTGGGVYYFTNSAALGYSLASSTITEGEGFTLLNSASDAEFAAPVAITSSTDATRPVFTVASTAALSTGMSVRVTGISGQTSLNGYEFEIEVLNGTTFRPRYAMANAPGVAGTGGFYSVRLNQPLFSPKLYAIFNITASVTPVVTFAVAPDIQVGDNIRLTIDDAAYGAYTSVGNQSAKVTAVSGATVTLSGIDTSAYGTFPFPLPARVPFSPANAIAFGSSVVGVNDSVVEINNGFIGMKLGAGADRPAGASNDLIYWSAGKSFSVNNE